VSRRDVEYNKKVTDQWARDTTGALRNYIRFAYFEQVNKVADYAKGAVRRLYKRFPIDLSTSVDVSGPPGQISRYVGGWEPLSKKYLEQKGTYKASSDFFSWSVFLEQYFSALEWRDIESIFGEPKVTLTRKASGKAENPVNFLGGAYRFKAGVRDTSGRAVGGRFVGKHLWEPARATSITIEMFPKASKLRNHKIPALFDAANVEKGIEEVRPDAKRGRSSALPGSEGEKVSRRLFAKTRPYRPLVSGWIRYYKNVKMKNVMRQIKKRADQGYLADKVQ